MSDIFKRTQKLIAEHIGVEIDKVIGEASITDDLGGDSLDAVEIVMAAEEEFHIEIPDSEAEECKTVGEFVVLLEKIIGA